MGLTLETSVSALTVFAQGLLSFFSPCVLPLLPIYISYLAGGAGSADKEQNSTRRRRILVHTLCFVLGIAFVFVLLGFGFTKLGQFFNAHRKTMAYISGAVMIAVGLVQLGGFRIRSLQQEKRFTLPLERLTMNPLVAFLLGFTFSFAWTPCIGPILASVLLMVSASSTIWTGLMLIGVYTLGFVLPFLAVGLFADGALQLFKRYGNVVKYTVKIGGALLILMGILTMTGHLEQLTTGLATQAVAQDAESQEVEQNTPQASDANEAKEEESSDDAVPAPDFTLLDQYGNTHKLSDYQGKTIFLNFWATWCPPCRKEMPDIQALYEEKGKNTGDVVVLGIASPRSERNPNAQEQTVEGVTQFLKDHGYSFPVLMDDTGAITQEYMIRAFPTTFMIDAKGNVFGYLSGAMHRSMMEQVIQQTIDSVA